MKLGLITDENWRDVERVGGVKPRKGIYARREAKDHGLVPCADAKPELIPWDDMEERINEANAKKQMPMHYLDDFDAQPHNQGRTNFCWNYGLAMTMEAQRLIQHLPYRRLGGPSLGWIVGWKNRGGYLTATIKGAIERGIASSEFIPDGVYTPATFKDGWEDDALNNRPLEFTDTDRSSERFMAQQCASLLVQGEPLYVAFNWWSHALTDMGVIWDTGYKYNLRWVAYNSHGDGRIEMTGSKGVPDEAYAPRLVTHS